MNKKKRWIILNVLYAFVVLASIFDTWDKAESLRQIINQNGKTAEAIFRLSLSAFILIFFAIQIVVSFRKIKKAE